MGRVGKKRRPLLYAVLTAAAAVQLMPLILTLFNSLRTNQDIRKFPVGVPSLGNLGNFVRAWTIGGYSRAFLNSLAVSLSSTAVVMLASVITGFFLVRSRVRIRNLLFGYFGVALSVPVFSYLVPLYYTFADFNLVNSLFGLVLIYIAVNLPFNILMARTFIQGIPKELDEAATIDGCSTYQLLWRIIFPLSKPVLTTIALIVFVTTWNEFTLANTFLQSPLLKTAATRYVLFVAERGADMSMVYTAGIITILPIIIVFIALQNYFIDGMTAGSIK